MLVTKKSLQPYISSEIVRVRGLTRASTGWVVDNRDCRLFGSESVDNIDQVGQKTKDKLNEFGILSLEDLRNKIDTYAFLTFCTGNRISHGTINQWKQKLKNII